jgi:23S rRNA (pseudouridine1915-N3)-methyltransferase
VKVFLYYVGKAKDAHANALAAEYIKRTSRYAPAQMEELKPGRTEFWTKHPTATKILLDPAGKQLDSNAFANLFAKGEMLGHDLVFVIGGHDGLPEEWKAHADMLLSLSPMTMPHELARAVVAEQIYRAFTILRNHPYPR